MPKFALIEVEVSKLGIQCDPHLTIDAPPRRMFSRLRDYFVAILAIPTSIVTLANVWVQAAHAAQTEALSFYVEESRPLSWRDPDGSWHGIAADRVVEMMRRAKLPYTMELMPWKRAYNGALRTADACVFGTGMTPEREPLFKWVHPVAHGGVSLYVRADDPRPIDNIQALIANKLVVAVKSGDITEATMRRYDGVTLQSGAEEDYGIKKLVLGRVDVWAGGRASGLYQAKQLGAKVKRVLDVQLVEVAVACNPATPDAAIRKMNDALQSMWADGAAQAIEAGYAAE